MKSIFTQLVCLFSAFLFFSQGVSAQCTATISMSSVPSRCKATGQIIVNVSGGSGNYNYKVVNGTFSTVTSTHTIGGLAAGTYTVEVKDIVTACVYNPGNIVVAGDYEDPRFQLNITPVSCINGNDASLTVTSLQYGRAPFTYTIVAPSASAIGTSNSTGIFNGLRPGDYYVRLMDSCGGIQTRAVTIANYDWWIDTFTVAKPNCTNADVTVTLRNSKGNTNTAGTDFNGYRYGVVRSAGDTVWSNNRSFSFVKGTLRSFTVIARDLCGNTKTRVWTETNRPAVATSVTISNQVCAGFRATVTGQVNLTNAQYCLFNSANVQVACNTTGVFDNIPYGNYCINIRDNCYDTTIQRCFTVAQPVPAVAASISISNLACSTFTATVTGQANLTSPQYCLYNSSNVLVACNTTGVFTNVPFGSYCIRITDGCTGTVINRCFTQLRVPPAVAPAISISNRACTSFSATVTGQTGLTGAQYCIYTSTGTLIACNSTGVFNGLPYGNYCINVNNNPLCYDTTIVRCFSVTPPVPSVAATVSISNQTCTNFRATITGQTNLNNPTYCLYTSTNILVSCNGSGQFNNLPYGSYCIRIANNASCYDTTIVRCFTVNQPVPAVAAAVTISNRACSTFTASITGQTNLTSPTYYLYNSSNNLVTFNSTGVFNSLPYGNYCIRTVNTCYDTTIQRCFTAAPLAMALNVTAAASCTIGTTDFNASWVATTSPYTINIYNPGGVLVRTVSAATNSAAVTGLPGLPVGLRYKVVITDQCTNRDSVLVTPNASWFNKSVNANSKCPSGQWQNGSGDLTVFSQYSHGTSTPKLIRKNGAVVNILHNFNSGNNYTFSNMEPATYVVEYTLQNCSGKLYDTFNLAQYAYPSLNQSAVYQCNNNSFGVNSIVNNGQAPFTYEIMGSLPAFPSIAAAPQASPLFNINNGNSYSLVRLRVIDACGNATINDASILPLANTIVNASSNCYYNNITLTVDTVPNATYTWYRKTSATDSVQIGTAQSHNIPYLMPQDTGVYVCKVSVNGGCLTRVSSFRLDGACGTWLLSDEKFSASGKLVNEKTELEWRANKDFKADKFVVERSTDARNFTALGTVNATQSATTSSRYLFTDNAPVAGNNFYRIKIINGHTITYSKVIEINKGIDVSLAVIPNPVNRSFTVRPTGIASGVYELRIVNAGGGVVHAQRLEITQGDSRVIQRPASIKPGLYFLVLQAPGSGERTVSKIIFQ
jgi:hypothetical protein